MGGGGAYVPGGGIGSWLHAQNGCSLYLHRLGLKAPYFSSKSGSKNLYVPPFGLP